MLCIYHPSYVHHKHTCAYIIMRILRILQYTVYRIHTHTHTRKHTHTHTHSLPLCIASASVYHTRAVLDYMRDRPQCISGVAPHRRQHLLSEFQEALQRFFFCLLTHTHTHTHTAKLDANFMHHKMHTYYMCMHVTNDTEQEQKMFITTSTHVHAHSAYA